MRNIVPIRSSRQDGEWVILKIIPKFFAGKRELRTRRPDGSPRLNSPNGQKSFWAFAVDFWRDRQRPAWPLSPRRCLLPHFWQKAFDVPALSHLRDISYAWALAPLLIWVLVA